MARGASCGLTEWNETMARYYARTAAPDRVADELAVARLLRVRFLATDPLYGGAAGAGRLPDRARLEADRWNIEHDLCWWYREALGLAPRAAEHGRAAIAAWDALVAAGQAGTMATDPATFQKLADCAAAAGDDGARRRFEREWAARRGGD